MSVNNLVKNTLEIINVKRRQQIINDSQIKNIFFFAFFVTQHTQPNTGGGALCV